MLSCGALVFHKDSGCEISKLHGVYTTGVADKDVSVLCVRNLALSCNVLVLMNEIQLSKRRCEAWNS